VKNPPPRIASAKTIISKGENMGDNVAPGSPVTQVAGAHAPHAIFVAADRAAYMSNDRRGRGGWMRLSTAGPTMSEGTSVAAVARLRHHFDFFVCGEDGGVHSTWWSARQERWGSWFRVGDPSVTFVKGAPVSVVSPRSDELGVFACDEEGSVWQAWWSGNRWAPRWTRVGNPGFRAPPGSQVSAVTRGADQLDLFVAGNDGRVYTIWWNRDGRWASGWTRVGHEGFRMPPGAPVTAVSRTPAQLDLFVCGNDGRVYSTWGSGQRFANWFRVGNEEFRMPPGAPVAAVAPHSDRIDLFVCGNDGYHYTNRWVSGDGWARWTATVREAQGTTVDGRRTRTISRLRSAPGTPVSPIGTPGGDGVRLLVVASGSEVFGLSRAGDEDWDRQWRQLDPLVQAPRRFEIVMQEDRRVTFVWDRVEGAHEYEFDFQGERPGFTGHTGTRTVPHTTYDFDAFASQVYSFRVRAVTRSGLRSVWSRDVRLTTPAEPYTVTMAEMTFDDVGIYEGHVGRISHRPSRLVSIQHLGDRLTPFNVRLLSPIGGRPTCGVGGGVLLEPGQTAEGEALRELYGVPEPEIEQGVPLVACKEANNEWWHDPGRAFWLRIVRRVVAES
jgi:hypothetical protein